MSKPRSKLTSIPSPDLESDIDGKGESHRVPKSNLTFDQLRDYAVTNGKVPDKDEFDEKILQKCNEACRLLFLAMKDKLNVKFGCFEIF